MQVTLTGAAEQLLADLYSANNTATINGFRIGGTAGFTPNPNGNDVVGFQYQGNANQIKYLIVSENEITFVIDLEDTVGQFFVGNIMLFLDNPLGPLIPPIPFLWVTVDSQHNKYPDDFPNIVVGDKLLIQVTFWFPYITKMLDLTGLQQFYAHLLNHTDELSLPNVDVAEYDQYILDDTTGFPGLSLVVKDNKHQLWWGTIVFQYINDPRLGVITGGIIGQPYGNFSDITYYYGSNYIVDNSGFPIISGGNNWAIPSSGHIPVNGGSY